MEKQELLEKVLRLYSYVCDEKVHHEQLAEGKPSGALRTIHLAQALAHKQIRAYIKDHFRPLV